LCKFNFIETYIKDLYVVEPKLNMDKRGYFMESYNEKEFFDAGLNMKFIQDNESFSKKGVLRGLHFQRHHSQGKLVRVTQGEVFDVAVDIRKKSPTYGRYYSIILSAKNKNQLYIPREFAHGFLVLSEYATFVYKSTDYYYKEYESGIIYNDIDLSINWPIEKIDIILSEKDKKWKSLKNIDS
jgi:dTDP-4-dehydrorhamnose 3,5-epimerase